MSNERFLLQRDASILSRLAEGMLRVRDVKFNLAEKLVDLLSGAILLPENDTRQDHVRLNSIVTFRSVGSSQHESIVIVCPQDADDVLAKVSILAPIAMALLGRLVGSIVEVNLPFGRVQYVEIVDIRPIEARHHDRDGTTGTSVAAHLTDFPTAGI